MDQIKIRVLLVEDNPGDVRLIQELLKEAGGSKFEFAHVSRLMEMETRLQSFHADVLLLDLGLPESQGLESLMKAKAVASHLPIIILTGLFGDELGVQAVANGAQDYLVKGRVDGHLLERSIRYAIERMHTEEELRESHELLERVFNTTHVMMAYLDTKFNFIRVNNAYAEADEHTPDFYPGKNHFALFPYAENETLFRKVVETGQPLIVFAKAFEYAEHPERGISYWDWSLQPVKASHGSVTALILSAINVTERIRAHERIQKLNRIYVVLSSINQAIVRIHDINLLLNDICRIAIEDGKFRMVWIGMINPQTKMVDIAASAGLTDDYLNKIRIDLNDEKLSQGPTGRTIISGSHFISNDIANDENMIPWREDALKLGYRSSASLPIKVLGTVCGVIKLYSGEVEFFTKDEIKLLDEMAMDISFALEFIEHEAKRKQAEEFLLKFRMGIERSGDAVLLTDPDGTIVYVNPAFENIFGYSKEEAIGKTPRILKSGTLNQEYYKNFWDSILTKKVVTHEIINKTKDDRLLSMEASVNPIIDGHGEIIGYLAIERDITERKRTEKSMREYAEQYRTMISATLFGFWLVDENGKLLDVNDTYCSMSGYTRKELLNLSIPDLEVIDKPEDVATRIKRIIENGVEQFESKHRAKDGRVFDIEASISYWSSQRKFIGFVRDITKRKREEKELIDAKERAELSDKLKDAFIANISHEIRTPLNIILGYTGIIEEKLASQASKEEKIFFTSVQRGADRLMRTVDLVLNVSRVQAGDVILKLETIQVPAFIENLLNDLIPLAQKKSLDLSFKNDFGHVAVKADAYCLSQALINLIDNAIKYTKKGSITVRLYRKKNDVCLDITDTGIGISKEYLEDVFKPYSQEEIGYTRAFEGIGLGLTLVKQYLSLHNVPITVTSKKGFGSTFSVCLTNIVLPNYLPESTEIISNAKLQTQPTTMNAESSTLRKSEGSFRPVVLVAEDDLQTQEYMQIILHKKFEVVMSDSVEGAWEIIRSHPIDLILLDISLQGPKNGLDLVRELRKSERYSQIPVIAVTAHAFPIDRINSIEAGCNGYIAKPMSKTKLFQMIDEVMKKPHVV